MSDAESRKLVDLKVTDLRAELEKRSIDRTGVKAVLIEKLQKALKDEGHDPETYVFPSPPSPEKKTPVRKGRKTEGDESESVASEEESKEEKNESEDEKKAKEEEQAEPVVKEARKEEKVDEEEEEAEEAEANEEEEDEEKGSKDSKVIENDSKVEKAEEPKKQEEPKAETPVNACPKPTPPKGPVIKKPTTPAKEEVKKEEKPVPEANGVIDNEDSINLTIGEDEEKLLAEEEDSSQEKEKKDDSNQTAQSAKVTNKSAAAAAGTTKSQPAKSNHDKQDGKSNAAGDAKQASKDDKTAKGVGAPGAGSNASKNLWVSGLSSATRATDLKAVFSKYGKVIGAKVVTNAKTPGARCYGYVTMSTGTDASRCVQKLHLSELHGRMISVEKAKGDSSFPPKKQDPVKSTDSVARRPEERRPVTAPSPTVKKDEKKKEEKLVPPGTENDSEGTPEGRKNGEPAAPGTEEAERKDDSLDKSNKDRKTEHQSRDRHSSDRKDSSRNSSHNRSREVHPRAEILSFSKIKYEQERQRLRERGRESREEERRKRAERDRITKQNFIQRKQREESDRLERERQSLKREREKIERERAELLKLERERQKLEIQRLEREREELKRQKLSALRRLEEERRGTKRSIPSDSVDYEDSRKRSAPERSRYESSSSRYEGSSSRYDHHTSSTSYRSRDDPSRPSTKERRTSRDRYESSKGDGDRDRYRERGGDTWHTSGGSSASNAKPYGAPIGSQGGHSRDAWISERKPDPPQQWPRSQGTTERWVSGGGPMNVGGNRPQPSMGSSMYQSVGPPMSGMPMGIPSSAVYGDRFDAYEQPLGPMGRKF